LSYSSKLFSGRAVFKLLALAVGLAGAVSLSPPIAEAQNASPWVKFLGNWRGSGEVIEADGTREHISCRAKYSASSGGEALTQSLRCASDSYSFDIGTYLVASGPSVSGDWQEYGRKVEGHITGRVGDGQFEGSIAGASFTAETSARVSGRKQSLSLRTKGAQTIKAEIGLTREN
jgi:hypothetical protein